MESLHSLVKAITMHIQEHMPTLVGNRYTAKFRGCTTYVVKDRTTDVDRNRNGQCTEQRFQ